MVTYVVYPGSFCPPTFGHFRVVERAVEIFSRLIIICSENPDKKDRWFTAEECQEMWSAYRLPAGVEVLTLAEFSNIVTEKDKIIMVRGLRDEADFAEEKKVMFFNKKEHGVTEFFYMFSECYYQNFSSSRARKAAQDLDFENLGKIVAAKIVSKMLEKVLQFENLFLVVGPTGSGKSTFLNFLKQQRSNIVTFDTDLLNAKLRPLLMERFGDDLIKAMLEDEETYTEFIKDHWFNGLAEVLRGMPKDNHVFLEVPYALRPNKKMYRFLGGKIIYIGCADSSVAKQRIIDRGTPELIKFFDLIPNFSESLEIIKRERLELVLSFDTSQPLIQIKDIAAIFITRLS